MMVRLTVVNIETMLIALNEFITRYEAKGYEQYRAFVDRAYEVRKLLIGYDDENKLP